MIAALRPHIVSSGFAIEMEMITRQARLGFETYSVPITYAPRVGESNLRPVRDGLRILVMFARQLLWTPPPRSAALEPHATYSHRIDLANERFGIAANRPAVALLESAVAGRGDIWPLSAPESTGMGLSGVPQARQPLSASADDLALRKPRAVWRAKGAPTPAARDWSWKPPTLGEPPEPEGSREVRR